MWACNIVQSSTTAGYLRTASQKLQNQSRWIESLTVWHPHCNTHRHIPLMGSRFVWNLGYIILILTSHSVNNMSQKWQKKSPHFTFQNRIFLPNSNDSVGYETSGKFNLLHLCCPEFCISCCTNDLSCNISPNLICAVYLWDLNVCRDPETSVTFQF